VRGQWARGDHDEQRDLLEKLARSFGYEVSQQGDKGFLSRIKDGAEGG